MEIPQKTPDQGRINEVTDVIDARAKRIMRAETEKFRVHVAGPSARVDECAALIAHVRRCGCEVTYDWTPSIREARAAGWAVEADVPDRVAREQVSDDLDGVRRAHLVVALDPHLSKGAGREVVAALALGIPVLVVSDDPERAVSRDFWFRGLTVVTRDVFENALAARAPWIEDYREPPTAPTGAAPGALYEARRERSWDQSCRVRPGSRVDLFGAPPERFLHQAGSARVESVAVTVDDTSVYHRKVLANVRLEVRVHDEEATVLGPGLVEWERCFLPVPLLVCPRMSFGVRVVAADPFPCPETRVHVFLYGRETVPVP